MSVPSVALASEANAATDSAGYTESWIDENGDSIVLSYTVDGEGSQADSHAALYVNGVLTQESYSHPSENKVTEYTYSSAATRSTYGCNDGEANATITKEYTYSNLIQAVPTLEVSNEEFAKDAGISLNSSVPFPTFESSGWALVDHWNAASASPYAIDLYLRNYDDEPDRHPFEKQQLNFAAKVAITTVVAVIAGFITTGGITVAIVLKAFGAAIIKEGTQQVLNKAIKGTVCYSTQKIRYAPVVEGYNIYPNAYMTRLWLVAGNAYTGGKNFTLLQDAYKYNPQPSTTDLMYAARHYFTDWARDNGYLE